MLIVSGFFTVTLNFATAFLFTTDVTVIVAVPAFFAVTFPLDETVATFLLLELQVTALLLALLGEIVAFKVRDFPFLSVADVLFSFMLFTGCLTVTLQVSFFFPYFADGYRFANENGLDNCLLLNDSKNVVEALQGNIFMLLGSKLITPPISEGCLNGVMRKQILNLAKKLEKLEVVEEPISPFDLQKADELFIKNVIKGEVRDELIGIKNSLIGVQSKISDLLD